MDLPGDLQVWEWVSRGNHCNPSSSHFTCFSNLYLSKTSYNRCLYENVSSELSMALF